MKHIIPFLLVFLAFSSSSCQQYGIEAEAMCWRVGDVDSNLVRMTQVSYTGATRILGYINTAGQNVDPATGTLLYGSCECCHANDTIASVNQIISFFTSQPTQNPLNPHPNCVSNAGVTFPDTVDEEDVEFKLNGVVQPFTFFPLENPKRAAATLTMAWGSGFNVVTTTVSNELGTTIRNKTIDCGGG